MEVYCFYYGVIIHFLLRFEEGGGREGRERGREGKEREREGGEGEGREVRKLQ